MPDQPQAAAAKRCEHPRPAAWRLLTLEHPFHVPPRTVSFGIPVEIHAVVHVRSTRSSASILAPTGSAVHALHYTGCGRSHLDVYLIDGTYELFRHFHALPSARDVDGREVAAVRGVVASVAGMLNRGATHVGVATDHVIESFRNDLWPGYKTGAGIDPDLLSQFQLLEDALRALGVAVWPMIEFEADDGLAMAARQAALDPRVDRVIICTPDKDLSQCVRGTRVVQMDRRRNVVRDEAGVVAKFGVSPASIPDYLALVGDSADGYPGLAGWGAKSAAAVLGKFGRIERIPEDARDWHVNAANAGTLAATLHRERERAYLFRDLATLRDEPALFASIDELRWTGPTAEFPALAKRLDAAARAGT